MFKSEFNRVTTPYFGMIHQVTAYHGAGEILIQAYNPGHQAEGGEVSRFIRAAKDDGPETLGKVVLSALDFSQHHVSEPPHGGWMLMRGDKPGILWKKLVMKSAICLIRRSAFAISFVPTKRWEIEEGEAGLTPIEKKALHLMLDAEPREIGKGLLETFAMCV
jgi:hypothetical protein